MGLGDRPQPQATRKGWTQLHSACIDGTPESDLERLSFRHEGARGGSSGDLVQSGVPGGRESTSMRCSYLCEAARDEVTIDGQSRWRWR